MQPFREKTEPHVEPLLISAKQAGQLLGISPRHLYTLAKRGELSPRKIGRKVMFRMADLQRFAAGDS